jgi:hypothetical protein
MISVCSPKNTTLMPGRMLGNFLLAFSHDDLINTAINLASVEASAAMGLQPSQG